MATQSFALAGKTHLQISVMVVASEDLAKAKAAAQFVSRRPSSNSEDTEPNAFHTGEDGTLMKSSTTLTRSLRPPAAWPLLLGKD